MIRGLFSPFSRYISLAPTALFVLISGCGAVAEDYDAEAFDAEATQERDDELVASSSLLFMPQGNSNRVLITLCWKPSAFSADPAYATKRDLVHDAIETVWDDNTWIDVSWSNSCSSGQIPIEIFAPTAANQRPFGSRGGLNLSFTANNDYIRYSAVHEFGHALGFEHEQARSPGGIICAGGAAPVFPMDGGNLTPGPYWVMGGKDTTSFMAYCPEGITSMPSAGDLASMRAVYGGESNAIKHNTLVAVRNANGTFWGDGTSTFSRAAIIKRSDALSGSIKYGDRVNIQINGLFPCGSKGSAPPPGVVVPGGQAVVTPPKLTWNTGYTPGNCDWTVEGNAGGTTVDVNDPFQLHLRLDISHPQSGELAFDQTMGTLRLLRVLPE